MTTEMHPVVLQSRKLKPAGIRTSGIDLEIHKGRRLGLWGESGSGKTALLRALAGLDRAAGGQLFWNGTDATRRLLRPRGHRKAFASLVLSNPYRLFGDSDSIGELLDAYRVSRERFYTLSQAGGLLISLSEQRIRALSGTWRARLALLCALASNPAVLLIDDIWAALVPESWEDLWGELDAWAGEAGSIVVASRWWQALSSVDTVAVLWHGEVVEWGERESVLSDPRHPYTRHLRETAPGEGVRIAESERQDWLRRGMAEVVESAPQHWMRLPVGIA